MKLWAKQLFNPIERKRFTWAGTLGTAVLLGGAGVGIAGKAGAFGKKKAEAVQTYFPSQDPRFQRAQKELEDILSRRGYFNEGEMGYTPETINATTAPYATARRANLANYELPLISAQASARGLGRSTIPVNRAALSSQEAERDINERLAQMISESEQLKGSQKSINAQAYQNAISGIAGLGTQETAAQQAARERAATTSEINRGERNTSQEQAYNSLIGGSLSALGGNNFRLFPSSNFSDVSSFKNITSSELADAFDNIRKNRALVNRS